VHCVYEQCCRGGRMFCERVQRSRSCPTHSHRTSRGARTVDYRRFRHLSSILKYERPIHRNHKTAIRFLRHVTGLLSCIRTETRILKKHQRLLITKIKRLTVKHNELNKGRQDRMPELPWNYKQRIRKCFARRRRNGMWKLILQK
jgi:hypothetical protein